VRAVIETCRKLGVEVLSLYAFSTENWRRSKLEVNALFRLLSKYIQREIDEMDANNIRICFMGRREGLPGKALADMDTCLARTSNNTAMTVNIAINYGGRGEIVDATRHIAADVQAGLLAPDEIDEETFSRYLYQPELDEVDLLIRTSGELRVSNFMLWQVSYAEILVPDTLWPDFDEQCLCDAIVAFQQRNRRFGGRP
jgi:undecaprenyl diphosphate synthase